MSELSVQGFDEGALADLLHEYFGVTADSLRPSATFDDLGLDSLGLMELAVALEDRTGVEMADQLADLTPASTLSEAARAIERAITDGAG